MRLPKRLGLALFAVFFALSAHAQSGAPALETPSVVGVYLPSVSFEDSLSRARFAEGLAASLQASTGSPFRGRAFAAAAEFQAQVATGGLHFAVADAAFVLQGASFRPLAQAHLGGNPSRPMVLVVDNAELGRTIGDLAGRSLLTFDMGAREDPFIKNFVFQGQLGVDYFKRQKSVRDVQAALTHVRLGKAQATLAFEGGGGGLRVAFKSRPAPLPIFALCTDTVDAGLLSRVKATVVSLSAPSPAFEGFGPYNVNASANSALRSALASGAGGGGTDLVFAAPNSTLPTVNSQAEATVPPTALGLPTAAELLTLPAPPPDVF